jgi:hypothetical protein
MLYSVYHRYNKQRLQAVGFEAKLIQSYSISLSYKNTVKSKGNIYYNILIILYKYKYNFYYLSLLQQTIQKNKNLYFLLYQYNF